MNRAHAAAAGSTKNAAEPTDPQIMGIERAFCKTVQSKKFGEAVQSKRFNEAR